MVCVSTCIVTRLFMAAIMCLLIVGHYCFYSTVKISHHMCIYSWGNMEKIISEIKNGYIIVIFDISLHSARLL